MAHISLKHIEKSFGDVSVLRDVSLDVLEGEFLTLVGPSGCGKSTLLRILAGLEASDYGQVEIKGRDVTRVRPAARDLAMVFQSYALYPHLSVLENMLTPLKLRDLGWMARLPIAGELIAKAEHKALKETALTAAQTLKIDHLLDRKPGQLSGGQRQRVALGRAMVRQPVAFLMDEPLSNLDAALRVHMRAELSQLHKNLGTTFIYVTHDQAEAMTMSSRMAVMMDGHILQLDTPHEIYRSPLDLRVAEFIGSPKINRLPAEVDGSGRISVFGQSIMRSTQDANVKEAWMCLRPEHLELSPHSKHMSLPCTLSYFENLGSEAFAHVSLSQGTGQVVVRLAPEKLLNLSIGQKLFLSLQKDRALLFAKTGQRLYFTDEKPVSTAPQAEVA